MKIYDPKNRTFFGLYPIEFGVLLAVSFFVFVMFIAATYQAIIGNIKWFPWST